MLTIPIPRWVNEMNNQIDEIIKLQWKGPFGHSKDGLVAIEGGAQKSSNSELTFVQGKPGIYLFCIDHPIHGPKTLAYIGRAENIGTRLSQHQSWLEKEWNVAVFAANCPKSLLQEVEALLIYAHAPIYNGNGVSQPPDVPRGLHVRNEGRFWGLFPDVCASHPWHSK